MRHRSIVNSLGDLITVDRPQTRVRPGSLGLSRLDLGLVGQRLSDTLTLNCHLGSLVRQINSVRDLVCFQ
ncbi:hypothetical protein MCHLDSM_01846 [Mycolicibacterium chlorophenolicum]|uniref:Uncharacterized protein n=1 Tax=Mycolicibacterium chlorophenolicum TaxID=37916 RepID=A0A0J6YZY4_9MYCO|nr:hypothetical protein MCHLDSM_01846 [Mycolicibacterium chlorophenolicum]